ncbi:phage major capsid protein, partial [Stieleria sp. TO1_6]|uniref:phage major capsid protein n=1 Tax=Stieleria tagensis TaxID=2956795 RepID=UPI00209BA8C1
QMKFGQRQLNVVTAFAMTSISRELWEDSPDLLASQLTGWLSATMAAQIDKYGLQGHTGGRPVGILNTPGIDSTNSIGGIDWTDVAAAVTSIRNANHEPNAVIVNPTIHDDLFNIPTGDGTNSARGWLEPPPTIRDKQYLHTTNCPLEQAVVGDFTKYLMGLRTGFQIETTTAAGEAFARHQVWIKATQRFDFTTLDDTAFHNLSGITS